MKYKPFNLPCKIFATTTLLLSSLVASATVEVKLIEPNKFRDIDVQGYNNARSAEKVQSALVKLFSELSEDLLADSQSLVITVTDIDLAGELVPSFSTAHDLRVVKQSDRYRLDFSYQLKNSAQEVVKEGEFKVKEFINFTASNSHMKDSDMFSYMKKDLEKWMQVTFKE